MTGIRPPQQVVTIDDPPARQPGVGRLLALLLPAVAAMYALFNGISAVILPAQVEAVDPTSKVGNLALLTTLAAVASMVAIPAGGAISDRTRSRYGRRTPWIAGAAVASAVACVLMGLAESLPGLIATMVVLWFTANFYSGAITAILPDRVPPRRRGVASAVIGLGTPVGIVFGVQVASRLGQLTAYVVIGAVLLVTTALLLLGAREGSARGLPVAVPGRRSPGQSVRSFFAAFATRDFRLAFLSRFMLFSSYFVVSGYTFYTLQDYIGTGNVPDGDVATAVSTLLTLSVVVWVVVAGVAGWIADRVDRRKLFVGVSALGVAASMTIPLAVPTWTGMLVYSACLGASIGTYFAIDLAVMSLVLPDADREGRDLGILQVATGLPQLLAGAVASAVITWCGGYPALFVFGILSAVVSGLLMLRIRSIR
ncbi:MFS transporter [Micromonospora sp. WMMD1128]|uniref:MFS transporter n=1 Tax=Micromonospora sp. WMMD1128 TaxID=3015150 RepID=UPI00248B9C51|nr:MFS transporter [Micromonospora sp. WMMD1128]WBB71397.1 MFS transporter [Micromonospora sp. WMMD1128]